MPYGFVGNASEKYLSSVSKALSSAHAVHNRDPYGGSAGGVCAPPALPSRNNHNAKHSPDSAMSGGYVTGVGNQSNVVVDQSTYDEILQKIHSADETIAESLYNVAVQIEEMCETIYIVPATLPKYLAIVDKVKASLEEFQSLTEQARMQAHEFVGEIMSIDGKGG